MIAKYAFIICSFFALRIHPHDVSYQEELNHHQKLVNNALHQAVLAGNTRAVKSALTLGAHINSPNEYGITPLMIAAQKADLATLLVLLQAGAQPDLLYKSGYTIDYYRQRYPLKKYASLVHALQEYLPSH